MASPVGPCGGAWPVAEAPPRQLSNGALQEPARRSCRARTSIVSPAGRILFLAVGQTACGGHPRAVPRLSLLPRPVPHRLHLRAARGLSPLRRSAPSTSERQRGSSASGPRLPRRQRGAGLGDDRRVAVRRQGHNALLAARRRVAALPRPCAQSWAAPFTAGTTVAAVVGCRRAHPHRQVRPTPG
jgi:hypothetical protein